MEIIEKRIIETPQTLHCEVIKHGAYIFERTKYTSNSIVWNVKDMYCKLCDESVNTLENEYQNMKRSIKLKNILDEHYIN